MKLPRSIRSVNVQFVLDASHSVSVSIVRGGDATSAVFTCCVYTQSKHSVVTFTPDDGKRDTLRNLELCKVQNPQTMGGGGVSSMYLYIPSFWKWPCVVQQ
jgi:hypothetical protein